MVQDLYPYLKERAQLGSLGLGKGVAASLGLHALALAFVLISPKEASSHEDAKVTWITLPAAGVAGEAGGQAPQEEGSQGERQRRVEEVAPKRDEPRGYDPTPNAWGTKKTKAVQGTNPDPDSTGKAPVAAKGKNPAPNQAPGAAGSGGGGGIGAATGIPGLRATNGVAGGTGLVGELDGDFPGLWYVQQIQARITANWTPLTSSQGRVQIYFRIRRDGSIEGARVEVPGPNGAQDQTALMAVRRSDPLPRLPDVVEGKTLGVRFWFTYLGR